MSLGLTLLAGKGLGANPAGIDIYVRIIQNVTLEAALDVPVSTVSTGQSFVVTMTVSNTGGTPGANLTADIWKSGGTASASISGPNPATVATLAPGPPITFSWTMTALTSGSMMWSATSYADGPVYSSLTTSAPVTVEDAANLVATASADAASVCSGQDYLYIVDVTNTGQADANTVGLAALFQSGPGSPVPVSGPTPASVASLANGATATFTYTATGAAAGTVFLTTTAGGIDANSTATVTSGQATASVSVLSAAVLAGSLGTPSATTMSVGQVFGVTYTVTNTGGVIASAVTAAIAVGPGSGAFVPVTPLVQSIGAGASFTFAWNYTPAVNGVHIFTGTATGTTCGAAVVTVIDGVSYDAQNGAVLAGAVAASATSIIVGQVLTIDLTVSNTGDAGALAVTPAAPILGGTATMTWLSGPTPASGVILGGADMTFLWTYSATAGGSLSIAASAGGTDDSTGAAVSTGIVASGSPIDVLNPANIAIVSLTLAPSLGGGGVVITTTLTVSNTGGEDATVNIHNITESNAVFFGLPTAAIPAVPFGLPAGTGQTIGWTYTATSCGTDYVTSTLQGTADTTGQTIGPVAANSVWGPGQPVLLTGTANPVIGRVGRPAQLIFEVRDTCNSLVPGIPISLVVVAPSDAALSSGSGNTDAGGQLVTYLQLGSEPGSNVVRGDVISGSIPSATVQVEGEVSAKTTPYLSRNFFNPKRAERLKIRVEVPTQRTLSVRVYNVAGELVRVVREEAVPPGLVEWEWDGRNTDGALVGNGTYFVQVVAGKASRILRVIVLKK